MDLPSGFVSGAYELRHIMFRFLDLSMAFETPKSHTSVENSQQERSVSATSGHGFEAVDRFQLIWSNQGSSSRRRLSIWRPVVPPGMVYFGDVVVQGYGYACLL